MFESHGIRTGVAAVGLVGVLAVGVVVLGEPREAGGARAHASSPVRAFAAERQAVSGPLGTIVRLRVPRGLYAVNAKVVLFDIEDDLGSTDSSGCKLTINDNTIDDSRQITPDHPQFETTRTHTLQFAGRLRGVLEVFCPAPSSWRAEQAKITAIRLTDLSKTP
jgi:hypothetical protein